MTLGMDGTPGFHGNGSQTFLVEADVVDENGTHLADLEQLARQALADWETFLKAYGVSC